jgi:hypothetical protein
MDGSFDVFLSHNSKDKPTVRQLTQASQARGLEVWLDEEQLVPGRPWQEALEEIIQTTRTAAVLVGKDGLGPWEIPEMRACLSEFVNRKLPVIPVLLPNAPAKPELPLFLRAFTWVDLRGGLTDDGLDRLEWGITGSKLKRVSGNTKKEAHSVSTSLPSSGPHTLTIQLEKRGPALDIHYYLPGMQAIGSITHDWQDALAARGDPEGGLFALLFGTETEWEPVFRRLFQQPAPQPRPNPIRAAVRLRICTEESLLLTLPWGLTLCKDYRLSEQGWTFTTTGVLEPTADVVTSAPCPVLVVAPSLVGGGMAPDPRHHQAVGEALRQICPTGHQADYVRQVGTRRELENALCGMRPHLVYVYAHGSRQEKQPGLLLDDGWLSLSELAGWFKQYPPPPAAVFLNVTGLTEPGLTPGQAFGNSVPLVIWRRVSEWEADAALPATQWLYRWLQKGEDPVTALHAVNPQANLAAHSCYRTWQTTVHPAAWRERLAHLVLNRDEQKALVGKHLKELARSDSRRIMALVAYAAPGNLLDALPEQLQHYLDLELADLAEINWRRLQFPNLRDNLQQDLKEELKLQLRADSGESVGQLLRRHAPRVVGSGKRAVLWLNWGIFGQGTDQQQPLDRYQLEQWLQFCSDFLSSHCPTDLRIVCYAAIELAEANHQRLAETLRQCGWQPWCRRPEFRLSVLPPLGKVSESHLYDFLVDGQSHCDPSIQAEIAQRLIAKTGGGFEPLVALIEEAEQGGSWYALLTRLQREQGVAPAADNEPF